MKKAVYVLVFFLLLVQITFADGPPPGETTNIIAPASSAGSFEEVPASGGAGGSTVNPQTIETAISSPSATVQGSAQEPIIVPSPNGEGEATVQGNIDISVGVITQADSVQYMGYSLTSLEKKIIALKSLENVTIHERTFLIFFPVYQNQEGESNGL